MGKPKGRRRRWREEATHPHPEFVPHPRWWNEEVAGDSLTREHAGVSAPQQRSAASSKAASGSIVIGLPSECCPATPRPAKALQPPANLLPGERRIGSSHLGHHPLAHQHEGAVGEGEGFRQTLLLRHPPGPVDPGAEKFLLKPRQIAGSVRGSRAGVARDRIKKESMPTKKRKSHPAGRGGRRQAPPSHRHRRVGQVAQIWWLAPFLLFSLWDLAQI